MNMICQIINTITSWEHFWTTVVSIVVSVGGYFFATTVFQPRKEQQNERMYLFRYLMGTRRMMDEGRIKLLNNIEVVFSGCDDVISAWHNYYESLLSGNGFSFDICKERENAMLKAMAKKLGFPKKMQDGIEKAHLPEWLALQEEAKLRQGEILNDVKTATDILKKQFAAPVNSPQPPAPKKRNKKR